MAISRQQYKKVVLELVRKWERELDLYNAAIMARQLLEWERIGNLFDRLINELLSKPNLSPNQLFKLDEYKRFMEEVKRQTENYARFNATLTSVAQREMAARALEHSGTLLSLISTNFSRLPTEAVDRIIGLTSDGSPLYDVLHKRFDDRADEARQILIDGVARGRNPNDIARDMKNQLDITRFDATRIARTEVINTYSQITQDAYRESGIVQKYILIAESDACEECLDLEAKNPYDIDDDTAIPAIHPHCRCAIAPSL